MQFYTIKEINSTRKLGGENMRTVNVHEVINNSKLNKFFLFVWFVCALSLFFDGFDQGMYGAAMPSMIEDLNLSPEVSGLLGSAAFWGAILGAILGGILTDIIGRKKMLFIGVLFYTVFTALCGTIQENIYLFAFFRFLSGMGIATMTPTSIAMLSEYTPVANRRFLLVCNNAALGLGTAVIPLVAIFVLPSFGWRILYLLAIIGLICLPMILKLPETMLTHVAKGDRKTIVSILKKANPEFVPSEEDEYVVDKAETVKYSIGALFRDGLARNTILIWIMFFINLFILVGMMVWLPQLGVLMGFTLTNALIIASLFAFGQIVGGIISGYIANRFGYKKAFIFVYSTTAVLLFVLTLVKSLALFMLLVFLVGCASPFQGLMYPFTAANYPMSVRATGMGMGSSMTRFGAAVSPIVIGYLVGFGFTPIGIFRFLMIPAIIGVICILLTKPARFDVD